MELKAAIATAGTLARLLIVRLPSETEQSKEWHPGRKPVSWNCGRLGHLCKNFKLQYCEQKQLNEQYKQ